MILRIFLTFIFLMFIDNTINAQSNNLHFSEAVVIGAGSNDSSEYIFTGIRDICLFDNSKILVADASDASIRVFLKNGSFQKKIGRRGRGPGEFHEVTSINRGPDKTIIVSDRIQERISLFSLDGEFLKSESLDGISLGTLRYAFYREKEDDFLLTYREYLNVESDGTAFHIFDNTIQQKISSVIDLYESIYDGTNSFEVRLSSLPLYFATQYGQNMIAYAPSLYQGTVLTFNESKLEEKLLGELLSQSYELLDFDKRNSIRSSGNTGYATSSGQSGRFFYRKKGSNYGLVGNGKFLLQFYALFEGKKTIPFVKIYDAEGQLLADLPLKDSSVGFVKDGRFVVTPHFLDEENNLYVSDYSYKGKNPAILVYRTNLDDFLK